MSSEFHEYLFDQNCSPWDQPNDLAVPSGGLNHLIAVKNHMAYFLATR